MIGKFNRTEKSELQLLIKNMKINYFLKSVNQGPSFYMHK